jgi:farnesyl diphosphate synthase
MHAGQFEARLRQVAGAVEAAIEAAIGGPAGAARPERLVAAMRHGALGGGKRLRPFLVVESAALFGAGEAGALAAATALELVHCYSLVHDDLPAMDDDDLRRGRPTVHRAFDEATAILAGDGLLTLAFACLADPACHADAGVRIELVRLLAGASGADGMVGGQMLDLAAEGRYASDGRPLALAESEIRRLQAMKTGRLILCALEMGAALGGADAAAREALARYGRALGAAFQIADDILDVEASAEALGKATGKDAGRGKGTLVGLLGLEAAKAEREALVAEALEALAPFGPRAACLRAGARFVAARDR